MTTINNLMNLMPNSQKMAIYIVQNNTYRAGYIVHQGKIRKAGGEEISTPLQEYLKTLPVHELRTFGKKLTCKVLYENFIG